MDWKCASAGSGHGGQETVVRRLDFPRVLVLVDQGAMGG